MDWFTPGGGSIKHCQPIWKSGICSSDLRLFFCRAIRSVLEYSSQLFHTCLPCYLSDEIERIQRRAMRIIFPDLKYSSALREARIPTLYDRKERLSCDLFKDIIHKKDHKLASLLPPKNTNCRYLRSIRTFNTPVCKTDRFKKSFMISHSLKM